MKVLLACEESQAVCIEFRKRGHEAYSCDILPCSGGHPEWHIEGDVLEQLNGLDLGTYNGVPFCDLSSYDKERVDLGVLEEDVAEWDLMIAFPPCTHLAVSGARWFPEKIADGRQQQGIDLFMALANAPIEKIAIENPIGIMSKIYRKPDQIIQPYYWGDKSRKSTCLWLKNLPLLFHAKEVDLFNPESTHVEPDLYVCKNGKTFSRDYMVALQAGENRGHLRSKFYPGISRAMAEQWG